MAAAMTATFNVLLVGNSSSPRRSTPLARLEVMQAVSERSRRSCCDRVELFLQRRWCA